MIARRADELAEVKKQLKKESTTAAEAKKAETKALAAAYVCRAPGVASHARSHLSHVRARWPPSSKAAEEKNASNQEMVESLLLEKETAEIQLEDLKDEVENAKRQLNDARLESEMYRRQQETLHQEVRSAPPAARRAQHCLTRMPNTHRSSPSCRRISRTSRASSRRTSSWPTRCGSSATWRWRRRHGWSRRSSKTRSRSPSCRPRRSSRRRCGHTRARRAVGALSFRAPTRLASATRAHALPRALRAVQARP
jgi:hypothetical protein